MFHRPDLKLGLADYLFQEAEGLFGCPIKVVPVTLLGAPTRFAASGTDIVDQAGKWA